MAVVLTALALCPIASAEPPKPRPNKFSPPRVDLEKQKEYRETAKAHACPKGIPWLQGTWEFMGQSRVPNFSDRITFKGTEYVETISGGKERGTITGDIACVVKNRILLRVRKVTPEGLFGNRSGDDYPCDLLTPVDRAVKDRMLFVCYVDWDLRTAKGLDLEFKKVAPTPKK